MKYLTKDICFPYKVRCVVQYITFTMYIQPYWFYLLICGVQQLLALCLVLIGKIVIRDGIKKHNRCPLFSQKVYSLKSTPNDRLFAKLFHGTFISAQNFYQNSEERKSPKKKFFFFFILMLDLIWYLPAHNEETLLN